MKKLHLIIILLGLVSANVAAMEAVSPACGAVLCLSPAEGMPPPTECLSWRAPYFIIQIWNPYFNESATSNARRVYLLTCTQARQSDISSITDTYGELMVDPIVY